VAWATAVYKIHDEFLPQRYHPVSLLTPFSLFYKVHNKLMIIQLKSFITANYVYMTISLAS